MTGLQFCSVASRWMQLLSARGMGLAFPWAARPIVNHTVSRWDQKAKMLVDARQIKAARSFLRWRQDELARLTGLALSTIRRLERSEGRIEANFDTVEKIRQVLENAGIEFIGSPNLGVRFWVQSEAAASPSQDGEAAIATARTSQVYGRIVG